MFLNLAENFRTQVTMRPRYRAQKFIQFEKFCYWRKTVLKIRERILDSTAYPSLIILKLLSNSSCHTKIQAER